MEVEVLKKKCMHSNCRGTIKAIQSSQVEEKVEQEGDEQEEEQWQLSSHEL